MSEKEDAVKRREAISRLFAMVNKYSLEGESLSQFDGHGNFNLFAICHERQRTESYWREKIAGEIEASCLKEHEYTEWTRDEPCIDCDSFEFCRINHTGKEVSQVCPDCSYAIAIARGKA